MEEKDIHDFRSARVVSAEEKHMMDVHFEKSAQPMLHEASASVNVDSVSEVLRITDDNRGRRNAIKEVFPSFQPRYLFMLSSPEIIETWLEMKDESGGLLLELENHWTLLHECVSKGIVTERILGKLRHQANNLYLGKSPVFVAEKSEIVEMFLRHYGVDLMLHLEDGWTLLQQCTLMGIVTPEIMRALTNQVVPSFGPRYLFEVKQSEILEILLDAKLEGLQLELENGWTLLHECSRRGIVTAKIVQHLQHQINSKNNCGDLPLSLTSLCEREFYDVANALLKIPGIGDSEAHDGLTGFAIALVRQHKETVKEFLHSMIEPREKIMFLATEFLKVSSVAGTPLHRWIEDFMLNNQEDIDLDHHEMAVNKRLRVQLPMLSNFEILIIL